MLNREARRSHRVPIAILLTLQLVAYLGGMATARAEEPATDPSATGSSAPAPTIMSDKPDYAPGETVTLSGEHWQPGEAVHIRVDDDQERTWSHDADVTAGEDGRFIYQFALPTHFVAVYTVLATGELSGTATTSFTDANIQTSVSPSSVAVIAGEAPASVTITSEVQGAVGSGWKFTVPSAYTISGGTCTGSNPIAYAPSSQGGSGSQTFTTFASVSAASGQAAGTFTCTIQETISVVGSGASLAIGNSASLQVTVSAPNQAPVAVDDSYSTAEDTTLNVSAPGVLDNDTDVDGDALTAVLVTGPTNGTLALSVDGSFSYTPDANFCSSDSFTYKANDGTADSNVATVSITVTCVNDAPTIAWTVAPGAVDESTATEHTYTFSITDPDSSAFVFADGYPACGTGGTLVPGSASISGTTGTFKCLFPDGPASPEVKVKVLDDEGAASNEISREVAVANVAPVVILDGPASAEEGETVSYSYTFTDPGADTWTASVSCGANGTVSKDSFDPDTKSGSFECTWPDNFEDEVVSATVTDDDGGSGFDTKLVDIANVAPEITSASFNASSVSCAGRTVTLTVEFTDPGADTWLATINWGDDSPVESVYPATSPISATHTYALAGSYTATIVVADDDHGEGSKTAEVTVNYTIVGDGFLPPINNTGHGENPSLFKYGSTIPVKVKVQDCDGSYPSTLAPKVTVQMVSGTTPGGGEMEPGSTSAADTGNTMRFTGPPDLQYIYNLASKSFASDPTSAWLLIVRIPATGQEIKTTIGFKK